MSLVNLTTAVCYLPPLATKTISTEGFCLHGHRYNDSALQAHIGEEVMLFAGKKRDEIQVCLGSELICIATVQRITL
jgi:hypothetical protein